MWQLLGKTKQELSDYKAVEKYIVREANYEKIPAGPCSKEKMLVIQ